MNIANVKQQIAEGTGIKLPTLMLSRQLDKNKVPQPWVSHWDNDARVRITMHDDVANKIAANPTFDGLAFKRELVPAKQDRPEYIRFVVINPSVIHTF